MALHKKPWLFLFFLIVLIVLQTNVANASGKPLLSRQFRITAEMVYEFRFKDASLLHSQEGRTDDVEKAIEALMLNWWQGLTYDHENGFFKELKVLAGKSMFSNSDNETLNSKQLFLSLLAGIYRIRLAAIENDKAIAGRVFFTILPNLKIVLSRPDEYEEYMLLVGVYNHTVGGIRRHNILLRPFLVFLPPANADFGKEMLYKCTNSENIAIATEAHYFLFKIESEIYDNPVASKRHIEWLSDKFPENIVFQLDRLRVYQRCNLPVSELLIELENTIHRSQLSETPKKYFLKILLEADKSI